MITHIRILFTVFSLMLMSTGSAFAADAELTVADANRFIESLPALEAQAKTFQSDQGDTFDFNTPNGQTDFKNVYKKAVAALAVQSPADYAKLKQTLAPIGLSPTRWAEVGDRVMSAYMALNMREQNPNMKAAMQGLDMSQLENLPPEIRASVLASLGQVQSMVTDMQSAPQGDIDVVKTVRPKLEAYMEAQSD